MARKAKTPPKATKTAVLTRGARRAAWLDPAMPKTPGRARKIDSTQEREEKLIRAAGRARPARVSVFVEQARQAKPGDELAARAVISHFADAVHRGEPINPDVTRFIADAFAHYLAGNDTMESALGLKQRSGRRVLGGGMDNLVRAFYEEQKKERPHGALQRTAELLGLSKKQVERVVYAKQGDADFDSIL